MSNLKVNWDGIGKMISGRFKKADCHIKGFHAHKYINKNGFVRYLPRENLYYQGYQRCDEYITLYDNQRDIIDFIARNGLLEIQDNIDVIRRDQEDNKDFMQYEYEYEDQYLMPMQIGKTTMLMPMTHTEYDWTRNPNHSDLTGEARLCHYEYTSYKIIRQEDGSFTLEECPDKEDVLANKDEYPFIRERYYDIVYYEPDLTQEDDSKKRR